MGFFKSLKGDLPERVGGDGERARGSFLPGGSNGGYNPPAGPPPGYSAPLGAPASHIGYAPPPGPPPSQTGYAPPSGPPPSHALYAPPPGPPPNHAKSDNVDPPPYHDWTSIPDTALLPPPPTLGNEQSPTGNATLTDAIRAHQWCQKHPIVQPHQPTEAQHGTVRNGNITLEKPREYNGSLKAVGTGLWRGSTRAGSKDACLLSSMPLYFVMADSPFRTEVPKTVYFEVQIDAFGRAVGGDECSLAIGFCAVPYPTWRMPGWERGSLGVHADDGRRYINDTDGGKDFTAPFRAGETVGIGITFTIPDNAPDYAPSPLGGSPLNGEVFFTRNGKKDGSWSLQEELDGDSEFGILGLDGKFDLHAAVGTFGEVSFQVSLNSRDWLWRPK